MQSINSSLPIIGYMESRQGGRMENQDFMGYADTPSGFLFVLCDGMGGGPGGRTASTSVVEHVVRYVAAAAGTTDRSSVLREAVASADNMIQQMSSQNSALAGMGTTIVCLLLNKQSAVVAQVGDSRLYQFRMGRKVFQTDDHSYVADLVRKGALSEEEARLSSDSNIITRAINGRGIAEPNVYELPYDSGDRFVLCSDGIWGAMPAKNLCKRMTSHSVNGAVVDITYEVDEIGRNTGGHHDNLSIAIIETKKKSIKRIPMSKSILRIVIALAVALIASLSFNYYSLNGDKAELATMRDSVEVLTQQRDKLQKSLKDAQETIERRDASLQEKKDELKESNKELIAAKAASQTDKNENERLKAENEKLKKSSTEKKTATATAPATTAAKASKTLVYQSQINKIDALITSINKKTVKDASFDAVIADLKNKADAKEALDLVKNAKKCYKKDTKRAITHLKNAMELLRKVTK